MNPFQSLGMNSVVPSKYIVPLPSRRSNTSEKRYVLAAHISWIRELVLTKTIPSTFPTHDQLQEDEVQAFLTQGKPSPLGSRWMFLLLTVMKSPKNTETYYELEEGHKTGGGGARPKGNMTWSQIVDFIGESNFNFIWEQPQISLLSPIHKHKRNNRKGSKSSTITMESHLYLNKLLKKLYINLDDQQQGSSADGGGENIEIERFPVSNLSQALSIITSTNNQDQEVFLIFHQYMCYSLHDAVTFSPQKLASTSRQMFVVYQILHFLRDFQTIHLPLGGLSLKDFKIDECLYLNVIPWISDILEQLKHTSSSDISEHKSGDPLVLAKVKCIVKKVRGWDLDVTSSLTSSTNVENDCQIEPKFVEAVIRHWVEGLVSNYDYLMFLNFLCGRFCNGNPNFTTVFPWVSDFSSPMGGWRDFTKSKFRLNKGDRQLDIMFEEQQMGLGGGSTEKTVAHHVTDILSEITYYVYKARRTSKEVLCRFVRPKWVPNEYPSSMARLQDWTPDECIPDFFDDATILKSIHEDLPDLQVPKWCQSPEEFILQHRRMLESDIVSAKLHHWIDLTFGYKLSGGAAVKSKNIYLSLVDSHQHLESHGVVQLFQTAHPPRKNPIRDMRNIVQYKDLKKLREQEVDDHIHETATNSSSSSSIAGDIPAKTKTTWKNINLPKHYDPMGLFNDFEVTMNFFKTQFPYLQDPRVILTGLKDRNEIHHSVKVFGCLLLEIVLPQKFRHATGTSCVEEKFNFYKNVVKGSSITLIPLFCRRAVQAIFDRESLEFSIPINISLDLLLLGEKLGPIPFPFYFTDIYKMLRSMRNYEKVLATAAPDDVGYRLRLQELKVQAFSRDLIQLLGSLDNEGIDLVLPFVIEMFENPETRVLAVWNLFCPFAKVIGRKKASEYLLQPIVQIYESDYHSDKHLKLFHKTFLVQLCSCFGLRMFLEQFSTLLIEAIGGLKLTGDSDSSDCHTRAHLNSTDLEISGDQQTDDCNNQNVSTTNQKLVGGGVGRQNFKRSDSEVGDGVLLLSQPIEPEMFVMEPDPIEPDQASDSEGNKDNNTSSNHTSNNTVLVLGTDASFPSVFVNEPPHQQQPRLSSGGSTTSSRTQSPHQSSTYNNNNNNATRRQSQREGSGTRSSSVSSIGGGSKSSVIDISDVCFESVISLAHRLGPVLTAKYFSKNLLRMLTLCYLEHLEHSVEPHQQQHGRLTCDGDLHAAKVLDCLIAISDLYGDSFVERQYIPYCADIIKSASHKITQTAESALIGVNSLMERIVQYIPDKMLMALLQDPIIKDILSPLVELTCSNSIEFPTGGIPRALLASKCLSMMASIRKKIGPDLSSLHLKPIILIICKTFQAIYNENAVTKAEMTIAFDSLLASQIFTNFCDMITGSEYESLIRDLYLQQGLSERSASMREDGSPSSEKSQQKRKVEQQSSFGSRSFGNRIQVQELETTSEEAETSLPSKKDPTRHLKGNWLVYWDHEIGRSDSKFNFKQIKLHTFTGHTGSVRYIHALDNENSFLTASKDKTVKLFSLRNQGDESMTSSCQWTYSNHKKAVLSVLFHEPLHLAASTDGFVHIWDPFVGKLVRILEKGIASKNSPVCALRPILHTSNFVGAGIDSTVHLIDCRTCNAYELKIGIGQASGLVRCLAVSENGQIVSVGHSSGMLSTLDLRNGTLLGSWKGHDGEVLQLVPHRNKQLISSSFDQNISVWNLDENRLSFNVRGPTEPVHSMCTFESELISCTTSNRIGIHCGIDSNSDFSSTRLRTDTFKGVVTSMRLLPLNQFLLLGSEAGNVVLLC